MKITIEKLRQCLEQYDAAVKPSFPYVWTYATDDPLAIALWEFCNKIQQDSAKSHKPLSSADFYEFMQIYLKDRTQPYAYSEASDTFRLKLRGLILAERNYEYSDIETLTMILQLGYLTPAVLEKVVRTHSDKKRMLSQCVRLIEHDSISEHSFLSLLTYNRSYEELHLALLLISEDRLWTEFDALMASDKPRELAAALVELWENGQYETAARTCVLKSKQPRMLAQACRSIPDNNLLNETYIDKISRHPTGHSAMAEALRTLSLIDPNLIDDNKILELLYNHPYPDAVARVFKNFYVYVQTCLDKMKLLGETCTDTVVAALRSRFLLQSVNQDWGSIPDIFAAMQSKGYLSLTALDKTLDLPRMERNNFLRCVENLKTGCISQQTFERLIAYKNGFNGLRDLLLELDKDHNWALLDYFLNYQSGSGLVYATLSCASLLEPRYLTRIASPGAPVVCVAEALVIMKAHSPETLNDDKNLDLVIQSKIPQLVAKAIVDLNKIGLLEEERGRLAGYDSSVLVSDLTSRLKDKNLLNEKNYRLAMGHADPLSFAIGLSIIKDNQLPETESEFLLKCKKPAISAQMVASLYKSPGLNNKIRNLIMACPSDIIEEVYQTLKDFTDLPLTEYTDLPFTEYHVIQILSSRQPQITASALRQLHRAQLEDLLSRDVVNLSGQPNEMARALATLKKEGAYDSVVGMDIKTRLEAKQRRQESLLRKFMLHKAPADQPTETHEEKGKLVRRHSFNG